MLTEVPPNSTAVGVPAKIVRVNGVKPTACSELDQIHVTDPVAQKIKELESEIEELKKTVLTLAENKN